MRRRNVADRELTVPAGGDRDGQASYGPVLAAYLALAAALGLIVRRTGRGRMRVPDAGDVLMLGLATFKLSRLVTKEKVTQPLREPFVGRTKRDGSEVHGEPHGAGVRRAVGELLTCPFCFSVWIATGLTAMFAAAPKATRLIAGGLAAVVVADGSQYLFSALRRSGS